MKKVYIDCLNSSSIDLFNSIVVVLNEKKDLTDQENYLNDCIIDSRMKLDCLCLTKYDKKEKDKLNLYISFCVYLLRLCEKSIGL